MEDKFKRIMRNYKIFFAAEEEKLNIIKENSENKKEISCKKAYLTLIDLVLRRNHNLFENKKIKEEITEEIVEKIKKDLEILEYIKKLFSFKWSEELSDKYFIE